MEDKLLEIDEKPSSSDVSWHVNTFHLSALTNIDSM